MARNGGALYVPLRTRSALLFLLLRSRKSDSASSSQISFSRSILIATGFGSSLWRAVYYSLGLESRWHTRGPGTLHISLLQRSNAELTAAKSCTRFFARLGSFEHCNKFKMSLLHGFLAHQRHTHAAFTYHRPEIKSMKRSRCALKFICVLQNNLKWVYTPFLSFANSCGHCK
jgi:hypothetical protein